jgi:hypothetical protein
MVMIHELMVTENFECVLYMKQESRTFTVSASNAWHSAL